MALSLFTDTSPVLNAFAYNFEGIASEIEHPYGYDINDLPLDFICAELRSEYVLKLSLTISLKPNLITLHVGINYVHFLYFRIEQMMARMSEVPDSNLFS